MDFDQNAQVLEMEALSGNTRDRRDHCRDERGSDLGDLANLLEAGAAIDRAVQARQEWHQRRGPTLSARDRMQLARGLALPLAAAIGPTLMATLRLIQQAAFGKEGLFAGRKGETDSAITTVQRFVLEAHLRSPPSVTARPPRALGRCRGHDAVTSHL